MNLTLSELYQMIRFSFVGIAASVVHLIVAAMALIYWPELHEGSANVMAYSVAFMVSLLGHQKVTFQRKVALWRFLLLSWAGLGVNYAVLFTMLALGFSGMFAMVPAVGGAAMASYLLARNWAFAAEQPAAEQA